ncbi:MAG: glucosamine-6-phosphate deaminase [Kiritimatiellaeota bacterium]|nr:glucosamine-6-phosphate deaminase [Kiritimatiellota bacterium]
MTLTICETPQALGEKMAALAEERLNAAIAAQGSARLLIATGASQFETLSALVEKNVDWGKVEVFHLDEYIGMTVDHPASFRKYLKERFVSKVPLKKMNYVDGEGDVAGNIAALTRELRKAPIDVALIGIGENGHIAFNDPPADFATTEAYIVVSLDEKCRQQQFGEGWFPSFESVPTKAISMTVSEILKSKVILSAVPHAVKAVAVRDTLESAAVTPTVPATALKNHPCWHLFLDTASASLLHGH